MNTKRATKRATKRVAITVVAGFAFFLAIPQMPTFASTAADVTLGTSANYSLVSGGVIVLGVSTSFTGVAPLKGSISPGFTSPAIVSAFTTAGLTAFENNTAAAATALADVTTARNLITSLTGTTTTAEIGGKTFAPGVYDTPSNGALSIATTLSLDGGGSYSSVFIFRTTAAFNIAANLTISYINGAQPSNIYWVAGAATTLGANTTIPGNFISGAAITTGESSRIYGSVLGLSDVNIGASSSIIHNAVQAQPTPTPTTTPTPVTTTPPPGTSVFVPVPDLPQNSTFTSVSSAPCSTTSGYIVNLNGTFIAPISNIGINGVNIARSSWVQTRTQVSVTIPASKLTKFTFKIFNGRVPVLATRDFICSAPAIPTPKPVVTPEITPTPTPTPKPIATPVATLTPTPTPKPVVTPEITPTPTPTSIPTPKPIVTPVVTPNPTRTPTPIVTPPPPIENLQMPLISEISPAGDSSLHIVLHNLIPGQSVTITLKAVNP